MAKAVITGALLSALVVGCVGCATIPQPIVQSGAWQAQGLSTIEANVNDVIDTYNEEVKKVMRDGYKAWLDGAEQELADDQGKVPLDVYKSFMAGLAAEVDKKETFYDAKAESLKAQLNAQFYDVLLLNTILQNYNQASSVPVETWQRVLSSGQGLAQGIISIEEERRQQQAAEEAANNRTVDWGKLLDLFRTRAQAQGFPTEDLDQLFGALNLNGGSTGNE